MNIDVAIVALPLLGALIVGLGNRRLGDHAAQWITSGLMLLVMFMSCIHLFDVTGSGITRTT